MTQTLNNEAATQLANAIASSIKEIENQIKLVGELANSKTLHDEAKEYFRKCIKDNREAKEQLIYLRAEVLGHHFENLKGITP